MDRTRTKKTRGPHARPSAGEPAAKDDAVALEARWRTGPRTRAWSELWRRLLDGLHVARDSDHAATDDESAP